MRDVYRPHPVDEGHEDVGCEQDPGNDNHLSVDDERLHAVEDDDQVGNHQSHEEHSDDAADPQSVVNFYRPAPLLEMTVQVTDSEDDDQS